MGTAGVNADDTANRPISQYQNYLAAPARLDIPGHDFYNIGHWSGLALDAWNPVTHAVQAVSLPSTMPLNPPNLPQPARRISVVGTTGSGKTTLARNLARKRGVPHVELDALHWGPNWTPIPAEILRPRVAEALSGEGWTVDGNYSKVQDIVLARADTLVWLDYPFPVIFWQLLKRTLRRIIRREELWSGNRERLSTSFFSRDSILWWAIKTYRRRKRQYMALMADPIYQHLIFIRLRSPAETRVWFESVASQADPVNI